MPGIAQVIMCPTNAPEITNIAIKKEAKKRPNMYPNFEIGFVPLILNLVYSMSPTYIITKKRISDRSTANEGKSSLLIFYKMLYRVIKNGYPEEYR